MEKHKERKRACVPLQGAVSIETSYISFDDCFAALQIDLCVRGWIEGLWRNRRLHHPHQFPNYVCSIKRDFTLSHKERRLLYSFPVAKTRRRGNFPSAPDIQNLQHRLHSDASICTGRYITPFSTFRSIAASPSSLTHISHG